MSASWLESIDPWRAAQEGRSFSGVIALENLPRLGAAVRGLGVLEGAGENSSGVRFQLHFLRDAQRRFLVRGRIEAVLLLTCQRCMREMGLGVDVPMNLELVRADALGADVPDEFDPVVVEEDRARPIDWIEDELLLAIPVVPRHPYDECVAPSTAEDEVQSTGAESPDDTTEQQTQHPFAVLAKLKHR